MTDNTSALSWKGDGTDKKSPGQFLREIDVRIDDKNYVDEARMVRYFKNNLAFGGAADEWFKKLPTTDTDTYAHLTAAFELEWPLDNAPGPTRDEYVRELKDWRIKDEDLGKKVEGEGGVLVWSHVLWAQGLKVRARRAEDTSHFVLTDVYRALPGPIKSLIQGKPKTSYEELAAAVRSIDTLDLEEKVKTHRRDEQTARIADLIASPMNDITKAMAATHIQAPANPYPRAPQTAYVPPPLPATNPLAGGGGRGNFFGGAAPLAPYRGTGPGALGIGRGQQRPPQPAAANNIRNRPIHERFGDLTGRALPHHPNTPAGLTAYREQVAAWHTANPHIKPDEQHPYPLTPGSAGVGSHECWDCGAGGHMQGGAGCAGATLPEPERDWRRIAGFITRTMRKENPTGARAVNYVNQAYTPYPDYQQYAQGAYLQDIDDTQGNGEGPSV